MTSLYRKICIIFLFWFFWLSQTFALSTTITNNQYNENIAFVLSQKIATSIIEGHYNKPQSELAQEYLSFFLSQLHPEKQYTIYWERDIKTHYHNTEKQKKRETKIIHLHIPHSRKEISYERDRYAREYWVRRESYLFYDTSQNSYFDQYQKPYNIDNNGNKYHFNVIIMNRAGETLFEAFPTYHIMYMVYKDGRIIADTMHGDIIVYEINNPKNFLKIDIWIGLSHWWVGYSVWSSFLEHLLPSLRDANIHYTQN